MCMRRGLGIAVAALLAMGAGGAMAADNGDGYDGSMFSGHGSIRHSYVSPDDGGDSGHGIGIGGGVVMNFGTDFHFQASGNYDHAFTGGENADVLQGSSMLFWRDPTVGLFGVSGDAGALAWGDFADLNIYRAGFYGQYFGADIMTLSGGLGFVHSDGKSASTFPQTDGSGYYLQANLTYYLSEHFAVGTGAAFHDLSDDTDNVTTVSVGGEYLVPLSMPTSVVAAYGYSDAGDSFDSHLLQFGLKLHFGSDDSTIMTVHRSGAGDSGDFNSFILGY
jgi:hypothetical protein